MAEQQIVSGVTEVTITLPVDVLLRAIDALKERAYEQDVQADRSGLSRSEWRCVKQAAASDHIKAAILSKRLKDRRAEIAIAQAAAA